MLQDLLQQQRISSFVHGEHLQGAMGELPAAGLIRLVVNDADYAQARAVVERWDAEQPKDAAQLPAAQRATGPLVFLAGLAAGFALCFLLTGR